MICRVFAGSLALLACLAAPTSCTTPADPVEAEPPPMKPSPIEVVRVAAAMAQALMQGKSREILDQIDANVVVVNSRNNSRMTGRDKMLRLFAAIPLWEAGLIDVLGADATALEVGVAPKVCREQTAETVICARGTSHWAKLERKGSQWLLTEFGFNAEAAAEEFGFN